MTASGENILIWVLCSIVVVVVFSYFFCRLLLLAYKNLGVDNQYRPTLHIYLRVLEMLCVAHRTMSVEDAFL